MPQNDSTHDTFGFGRLAVPQRRRSNRLSPYSRPTYMPTLPPLTRPAITRVLLAGKRCRMWNQTIGPSAWYEQRCESQSICACLKLRA